MKIFKWVLVAFLLEVLFLLTYLYLELNWVTVKKYTVEVPNLPVAFQGFTILQLSDLHSKEFGPMEKKLIRLINQEKFDMVAVTGDMINGQDQSDPRYPNLEPFLYLLKDLQAKPVYFVPGNHEWATHFVQRQPLLAAGVKILDNKAEKLTLGNSFIWMVGVDDPSTHRDKLDVALKGIQDSQPKILLAHSPNIFPQAVKNKLDLVLVGHTHGGQINLPILGPLYIPGQKLFPQWDYGEFKSESTTMIVNSGLGVSDVPLRINRRPEITLITLISAESPDK